MDPERHHWLANTIVSAVAMAAVALLGFVAGMLWERASRPTAGAADVLAATRLAARSQAAAVLATALPHGFPTPYFFQITVPPTSSPMATLAPEAPPLAEVRRKVAGVPLGQASAYLQSLSGRHVTNWPGQVTDAPGESLGGQDVTMRTGGDHLLDVFCHVASQRPFDPRPGQDIKMTGTIKYVGMGSGSNWLGLADCSFAAQ